MAPSASLSRPHDRRPVVEIDDRRGDAAGGDSLGLRVVPDERRHLVAMLLQFRQHMGSDEACCAGQCHLHAQVLLTGSAVPSVLVQAIA
jgi:hypothetical protein